MTPDSSPLAPVRFLLTLTLALGVLVLPSASRAKPKPQRSTPIEARLELAAGAVTLDGREVVYSGAALPAGTRLSAGPGSRALARLSDGASIFLNADTSVRLRDDRVELVAGECWLDAPARIRDDSSYQLGDVVVTATDAGLDLSFVDGIATVYVARGIAVVSAPGGRVEVQGGERARVEPGAAPTVEAVTWWQDWTGGMADNRMASEFAGVGTGVVYGVDLDRPGEAALDLDLSRMAVRSVIRDGLAETEVDQTFANPTDRDLEGWYWFTVPAGATVTSFAVEHHGQLVEGEFVERKEARATYGSAVASGEAPAILEWVDGRSFRARIYPVPAMGTRRVVLRYLERLDVVDGVLRYVYPMQSPRPTRIGEFSLSVDLGKAGRTMDLSTLADARIEDRGRRVTMRRSGYTPVADFQLEARLRRDIKPVRASRFDSGGETADYVMLRYTPDVDWTVRAEQRADVVVVVDTSAAGDPESRALKTATAEAVLRALAVDDRFALVSLDVQSEVLHPATGLAPAEPEEIAAALERLSEHANGGATDLADFFDVALARLHDGAQPAVVYIGDGRATSGELTGDQLRERLRRTLATSRARLFTVAVGSDANVALLDELARTGGGQSLRVGHADEATERALRLASALKTPTITGLQIDAGAGLDDVMISGGGKVSYGGQITLLARTHHPLPRTVRVSGSLGGKDFERTHTLHVDDGATAALVPRFWAHEQMRRELGSVADPAQTRGRLLRLGLDYGLMTPFSSILALESEAHYAARGIARNCSPMRGVRLADVAGGGRWDANSYGGCGNSGVDDVTATSAARRVIELITPPTPPSPHRGGPGAHKTTADAGPAYPGDRQAEGAYVDYDEADEPVVREDSRDSYGVGPDREESLGRDPFGGLAGSGKGSLGTDGGGGGGYGRTLGTGEGTRGSYDDGRDKRRRDRRELSSGPRIHTPRPAPEDRDLVPTPPIDPALGLELPPEPIERITYVASCSDWARRPLWDRTVVWKKRLRSAGPDELLDRYFSARAACELPDWRSEATFLRAMVPYLDGRGQAIEVLSAFDGAPDTQRFVARLILRGTVDPHLVAAVESVLFGDRIRWPDVDLELASIEDPDARIERLREVMARVPGDSRGAIRLVRLLARAERLEELTVQSRRLREQGIMTPLLARELGDVLAARGMDGEAVRAYSEIVEFNPESLRTRKLLGDIYLGHGWYEQAYRQYASIDRAAPDHAEILLRMATAAHGQGRVDEALRIERRVASAPGSPGPEDSRRWARLLSAARIAELLETAEDEALRDGMRRRLKELQHFRAPGTLVLLSWQDLTVELELGVAREGRALVLGDATDAAPVGVSAVMLPPVALDGLDLSAQLRGLPRDRALEVTIHTITWAGGEFEVASRTAELAPGASAVAL